MRAISLALAASAVLVSAPLHAAVTVDHETKFKLSGGASVANIFAGDAAKDGLKIKMSIDGDWRVVKTGKNVELINLGLETIWTYKLNRRGKPGKCDKKSFDEQREAIAALNDLDFSGGQAPPAEGEVPADAPPVQEYEVTINMTESGEEETHAGITGKVYEIEVLVHRPNMTLEEGGGSRIESTMVIGPKPEGWDETLEWNRRYLDAIGFDADRLEGLGKMMASLPALKKAMDGLQDQETALDGAVLRAKTKVFTVADPRAAETVADAEDAADKGGVSTNLGNLRSKIGDSIFKRGKEELTDPGPREVFKSSTVLTAYSTEAHELLTLPERCEE